MKKTHSRPVCDVLPCHHIRCLAIIYSNSMLATDLPLDVKGTSHGFHCLLSHCCLKASLFRQQSEADYLSSLTSNDINTSEAGLGLWCCLFHEGAVAAETADLAPHAARGLAVAAGPCLEKAHS